MFAETREIWVLIGFSLIVGAMLGVFSDSLKLICDVFFGVCAPKKSASPIKCTCGKELEKAIVRLDLKIRPYDAVMLVLDVIFAITGSIVVIVLIYHLNYGQVRAVSLFSVLIGFLVYKLSIGRLIYSFMRAVMKRTLAVFIRAFLALLRPITLPLKRLKDRLTGKLKKNLVKKRVRAVIEVMERSEDERNRKRKNSYERDQCCGNNREGEGAVS